MPTSWRHLANWKTPPASPSSDFTCWRWSDICETHASIKALWHEYRQLRSWLQDAEFGLNMDMMSSVWVLTVMNGYPEEVKNSALLTASRPPPLSAQRCEILERAVEDKISTRILNFPAGWRCVRVRDVNSRDRDTCVPFMCSFKDDVRCYLRPIFNRYRLGCCGIWWGMVLINELDHKS